MPSTPSMWLPILVNLFNIFRRPMQKQSNTPAFSIVKCTASVDNAESVERFESVARYESCMWNITYPATKLTLISTI